MLILDELKVTSRDEEKGVLGEIHKLWSWWQFISLLVASIQI